MARGLRSKGCDVRGKGQPHQKHVMGMGRKEPLVARSLVARGDLAGRGWRTNTYRGSPPWGGGKVRTLHFRKEKGRMNQVKTNSGREIT